MTRFPALLLLLMLFPAGAAAQPVAQAVAQAVTQPVTMPGSCRLPAGLWQKREALQTQFDRSEGQSTKALEAIQAIDAQYRQFVLAAAEAYAQGSPQGVPGQVNACCDGVENDPEASIFCALIRYRLGGRKDPARFLAALPETPEAAAALVDLGQAASPQDGNAPSIATSPVYHVTDEIYRLMLGGYPGATARYFYLFRHSGGAYADDVADQLEHYLTDHPDALIRNWPVLQKYWDLSEGITWDVDAGWWEGVIRGFHGACGRDGAADGAAGPRCREILALLQKAARAAGAPQ